MIYKTVKALCDAKNISIAELEKQADLGNGTIGKWQTSKPNIVTLQKVAKALDEPLEKLLEDTEVV